MSTTRSVTNAAATDAAGLVVAANATRTSLKLLNLGPSRVYLGSSSAVTTATGYALNSGESFTDISTDAVWALTSTGTATIECIDESTAASVAGPVVTESRTFTETTGAGTYTATVAIPAGAIVQDVVWRNTAVWTAATSATLNVGDDDSATGYLNGIDIKTAPIADTNGSGAGLSTRASDTGTGAFKGPSGKYCAAAKTLTASVVTVGSTGSAGRSRLSVSYVLPTPVAATKA